MIGKFCKRGIKEIKAVTTNAVVYSYANVFTCIVFPMTLP